MNFDLSRMRRLMASFGNPQNKFPSVHIAGTNGKGSVAAALASILKESRLRVGLYTSPHLIHVHERFQINGKPISSEKFASLARTVQNKLPTLKPAFSDITQFEFLTAVAFLWFAEARVDIAVIEVGLGGRLDATNILTNVLATAITSLSLDHTAWLGKTIRSIAKEKAGIIKAGVPVVCAAQGEACSVIHKRARDRKSVLVPIGTAEVQRLEPLTRHFFLTGSFQKKNAAVAVTLAQLIAKEGRSISKKAIIEGLKRTVWPGRMETAVLKRRHRGPLNILLDGGHNPDAIKKLVSEIRTRFKEPVSLLFGVLKDKDWTTMAATLKSVARHLYLVQPKSERALPPGDLEKAFYPLPVSRKFGSVKDAMGWIRRTEDNNNLVVTGSLYLIGEVRSWLIKNGSMK